MVSLLYGNKISSLHLKWNGQLHTDFDIVVDLAICYKNAVFKRARYFKENPRIKTLHTSYHDTEMDMIRKLPVHLRHGFILAKAVRISSIAQPDSIQSFELQETVKIDDFISSFILKACLFGEDKHKDEFVNCSTPLDVSILIYELLQKYLNEKKSESKYCYEYPVFCIDCEVERGCCKLRKFMLAMVENVIQWLKCNQTELAHIDFSDNVKFNNVFQTDLTSRDAKDTAIGVSSLRSCHYESNIVTKKF